MYKYLIIIFFSYYIFHFTPYTTPGDFGPFTPGFPLEVPVWLALRLKQQNKCKVHPPPWLEVDRLLELKEKESEEEGFTPPPSPHYMELSSMLLKAAPDQIPQGKTMLRWKKS